MNRSLKLPVLLLLIGIALPLTAQPKSTAKTTKATTGNAFDKVQEGTIAAVNGLTVTVTYPAQKEAPKGKTSPKAHGAATPKPTPAKPGAKKPAVASKPVTKIYKITELTDVEINGQKASASSLEVGMAVSISADDPLSLDPLSKSNGGEARAIYAHDAPVAPSPTPGKKKK